MKKKQIIALVVAAVIFVAVGLIGVWANSIFTSSVQSTAGLFGTLFQDSYGRAELPTEKYMAVIDIFGTIQASGSDSGFLTGSTNVYDHSYYMSLVDALMEDDLCQGIILDVDSGGGTVYESDEFYLKLKEFKAVTNKPIYAYFRSTACSGAYYIAMAADKIYANRNCTTGSIGVIMSTYNLSELFDKIGIQEVIISSGKNKAMGAEGTPMTSEQMRIFQSVVDEAFDQFVGIVAEGRGMSESRVRALADGRIYTAQQALREELIDEIAGQDEFYDEMSAIAPVYDLSNGGASFMDLFTMAADRLVPKSDSQITLEWLAKIGKGVPLYAYYAQ